MGIFNKGEELKRKVDEDIIEEETDEENESEIYEVDLDCSNCGNSNSVEIPMGVLVSEFIKKAKCETCGCISLRVLEDEEDEE